MVNTIKYDYAQYKQDIANTIAAKTGTRKVTCLKDPGNGEHFDNSNKRIDGDLDNILTTKTGVCRHYALLMTGMLRSVDIPCKYVEGSMRTSKIIEGFSDDGWAPHT